MIGELLSNPTWGESPAYIGRRISDWYARSQNAKEWPSVFDRFIFLWIAFDAWGSCESDEWNEGMIDFVKSCPLQQHFKRDRLKIERSLQALKKEDIPDYRRDRNGGARISLDDPHNFATVMDVIFVIRNNLFHGHKSPTDTDDLRIVHLAYEVLSFLMSYVADAVNKRLPALA